MTTHITKNRHPGPASKRNRRPIVLPVLVAVWVMSLVSGSLSLGTTVEATSTNFASGSLIIPMDATYQNYGMFKAYGLVYRLLQAGIPVSWAIGNPKIPDSFGGRDFQATTVQNLPPSGTNGSTIGSPYNYTGGPFIIDSANASAAQTIINAWWAANGNQPAVHRATASFTANVDIILRNPPRIAVDAVNSGIAVSYFNAAGIPDKNGNIWSATSPNVLSETMIACGSATTCAGDSVVGNSALFTAGACSARAYDTFVTPHNSGYTYSLTDPTNLGTQAYAELDYFTYQGGGWTALCHSILSNENNINALYRNGNASVQALFKSTAPGGMLTQFGFPAINNVGGTWTVNTPDLPLAQAVPTTGATQGLPGGSVQTWHVPDGTSNYVRYWTATERVAYFLNSGVQYDWAVNGPYHNGTGRGKITFLGGHSYATSLPYSSNYEAPYLRFFYNSLFFNSVAVANVGLSTTPTSVPQGNTTSIQIAFRNSGSMDAINLNSPVVITLQSGVTYVSTTGTQPTSVVLNGDGTTTLTYPAPGTVAAGASPIVVNANVFSATAGTFKVASVSASYGDTFGESFTSNDCNSVTFTPAPGAAITKTPSTQGPVGVGSAVTWALAYSNPGSANLVNPYVEDILPSAFTYLSASPAPTYIIPVAGGTKLRWTLSTPLAAGGSGSITLRATVQTATGQPFTNNVSLAGSDASGRIYSASASATVSVSPPEATLTKTVSPTGAQAAGATLTYALAPSSPGPTLLNGVRFFDAPPLNTTYVANSVTPSNLGTFGAYVPIAGTPGSDTGGNPVTTMTLSEGATPFTYALGDTLTVNMALNNANSSSGPITNVTADLTPSDGTSTCVPLSTQPVASIAPNSTANLTFTCTIRSPGEITWDGDASGTFASNPYDFVTGTSPSVLGVPTTTGTNVVQWKPTLNASNTAAVPSSNLAAGAGPGFFAFNGTTNIWERYDIPYNSWITSPAGLTNNLPATAGDGAALVYDGNGYTSGYVYGFRGGGTNTFWRYKLSNGTAGTWTAVPPAVAPFNVGAGGALARLGGFLYALQGGVTTGFAKYELATDTWTSLSVSAPVPAAVGAGGALATDGTYIYALNGNNQKTFYRYNPTTNTWATMAVAPWNVKAGGALTAIGTTLYATQGNNHSGFAKYVPNATTGTWTKLANVPANVKQGGALATDGTYVYALRGNNQKGFYRYDTTANSWSTMASTVANITTGGALTWVPGSAGATLTNSLSAPTLVTGSSSSPATIQVIQTLTSVAAVSGVTPTQLTVVSSSATPASGTPAANCNVSPTGPQSIGANGTLVFTWTCTNVYQSGGNNANQNLGSLTFSAGATGTGATWTSATSNSVLVTQPLTYQVTVNTTPTDFTQVTNQALLSDGLAFATGVGSNSVVTPINRPPKLVLTKSVVPASGTQVVPGNTLAYTLLLQNTTPSQATSIVVTDNVPANSTLVTNSCAINGTPFACSGSSVTFNVGTLAGYGTATLTFQVTANTPAAAGDFTITNAASFTCSGVGGCTSGTSNSVSNPLRATPAVTISKAQSVSPAADSNGRITPGSTITYQMTVNNPLGAVPATGVVARDVVPTGTTYVSCATSLGSCSQTGGTVTYTIGAMAPNTTVTLTLVVTVDNPAEDGGTISNIASVSADTNITGVTYTVYSNLVSYQITAAPVISITKSANPASGSTVRTDDVIIYTLVVRNTGDANTNSAFVQDAIPAGTTYVANSTTINGVPYPEVTPGVPPVAGGMKVFSPGHADPTGDGGTLVSENAPGGTANNATITFQVIVTTPTGNPPTIANTASAGTATTPLVTSNTTIHNFSPTLVVISRFDAAVQDGRVVVAWETAVESSTAGFFLYRLDPSGGPAVQVNEHIVPALLGTTTGGVYRLLDPGAQPGQATAYTLVEIEARGGRREYGPFVVTPSLSSAAATGPLSSDAGATSERTPRPGSLAKQAAPPEPNTGTAVPEALPATADAPEILPLNTWLPLVAQDYSAVAAAAPGTARLTVRRSGLYYLAAEDIAPALGLSVAQTTKLIKSAKLKLTTQGQMVAYLAASGDSGLYFYGESLQSPYAQDNVYWLQQAPGAAMTVQNGKVPDAVAPTSFATSSHAERDAVPVPGLFNDPAADYWMWDYVVAADQGAGTRSFGLQADGAVAQGPTSLTASLLGLTATGAGVDHHAQIKLNGAVIGDAVWAGATPYTVTLPVNPELLKAGANTIEVVGLLDAGVPYSIFFVNSFDVSYQRAYQATNDGLVSISANDQALSVYGFSNQQVMIFDLSNPKLPRQVNALKVEPWGGAYRVTFKPAAANVPYLAVTTAAVPRITTLATDTPSNLKGPNAADYVVITTAALKQPAQALAAYRQSRGLQVQVVDVQDIYDEFNGGVASPQAVRTFLAYAYGRWKPAPRFVLLAGAGSYDYKNTLGYGDSLVPPMMVGAMDILTAADNRYGDVVGDDGIPEMAVGRLPVITPVEFQAYVAKIQAYEAADPAGWSQQVLMLADNPDPAAGNFPSDSDSIAAALPAGYTAIKVYLGPLDAAAVRSQTLAVLGSGTGVFNYIGHAGLDTLATERLLTNADVPTLHNGPHLPFMSAATCAVGNYSVPGYRSLAVLLALQADGGMAAVFAPTGSSLNVDGVALDQRLFEYLLAGATVRAGDATRAALGQFAAAGGPRYALDTYNLLGDPALEMRWR